jgi:ubiquinone/menaquinone biosynthesis C-methylase UbiE
VRRRAVGWLELREGQTVLDVACGTGLNFAALGARVGEKGRIIGVELSPEMAAIARERTRAAGWENVELVQSAVEDAVLPAGADAALFSFSHDVLRSGKALERVVAALRSGARVVAAGVMNPWLPTRVGRALARRAARRFVTTMDGLERPWSLLGDQVNVEEVARPMAYAGAIYLVRGTSR